MPRERSLRAVVEKWFGTELVATATVTRSRDALLKHRRYVRIEARQSSGTFQLFLFRHDNGMWCVFPPDPQQATLDVSKMFSETRVSASPTEVLRLANDITGGT